MIDIWAPEDGPVEIGREDLRALIARATLAPPSGVPVDHVSPPAGALIDRALHPLDGDWPPLDP